ncbi:hypothetical protein FXO38_01282 [Capsicum annuum]|nr:hypothetical protein FXO38_01282 [Capsicum annuum]
MHAAGMLPARKERKKSDMVQFRFDYLQYGSRFPKKSLGTIKKRYLGNENYRGLYWRDPMVNRFPKEKPLGSPRTFSTVLYPRTSSLRAKQDRPCLFPFSIPPPFLLCSNRSASRHSQSEALVIDKRFSKGDPLEFLSLKYSLSYQMKEFTIKLLTLLKYQRATHPMVWAVISSAWLGSSCWSSHAQRLKFILSFLLGVPEETYLLEALSVGIFLEIKTGFIEERSSSLLTRISLSIPTCVPPSSMKSLEHVRFIQDPCQERSKSIILYFMLKNLDSKRESIHVLHHFLGPYRLSLVQGIGYFSMFESPDVNSPTDLTPADSREANSLS